MPWGACVSQMSGRRAGQGSQGVESQRATQARCALEGLHATVQGQTRQRRASWVKGEEGQNGTADTGSEQSPEMEERRRAQADRRTGATFTLPDGRGRRGHRRRGARPLWDSAPRRRRRPLPEGLCPSAARLVSNAAAYQLVRTRLLCHGAPHSGAPALPASAASAAYVSTTRPSARLGEPDAALCYAWKQHALQSARWG